MRKSDKERNKRIAEEYGCVVTGWTKDIDPAHWPKRRSQGAGWGLLEFIPLRRDLHRLLDEGDEFTIEIVSMCANRYFASVFRSHPDAYMGPPERVREVQETL